VSTRLYPVKTSLTTTDPQQTRLHTVMTPIFNQMELDRSQIVSEHSEYLICYAARIIIIHCSFIGQTEPGFSQGFGSLPLSPLACLVWYMTLNIQQYY